MSQPTTEKKTRCPKCGKSFVRQDSASLPFCSDRCRLADLGRWLDERYFVPAPQPIDPETAEEMLNESNEA